MRRNRRLPLVVLAPLLLLAAACTQGPGAAASQVAPAASTGPASVAPAASAATESMAPAASVAPGASSSGKGDY